MSSKRIFQLLNAIHHVIAKDKGRNEPFPSKWIILVGDFLQLKPVPDAFNDSKVSFLSHLFEVAVPH